MTHGREPIQPILREAWWREKLLAHPRWKNLDKVKGKKDDCCQAVAAALEDIKAELDYLHKWAEFLDGISWSMIPGRHQDGGGGGGAPPTPPPTWPPP